MIKGILVFVVLVIVYNYIIYPIFLNKLIKQKIPGPFHLKLSSIFILNIFRKEQGIEYLHSLHSIYGPIVQIGPTEVSFNDLESVKNIYLYGNYPKEFIDSTNNKTIKTGFYSQFGNFGRKNLFSTGDTKSHLNNKKPLQKIYSKTFVFQKSSYIQSKIENLINVLKKTKGTPIDVYALFSSFAMDVVTGFEYGFANSSDFINQLEYTNPELQIEESVFNSFRTSSSLWFYTTMFPVCYDYVCTFYNLQDKLQVGRNWIWNTLQHSVDTLESDTSNSFMESETKEKQKNFVEDDQSVLETLYTKYNKDLKKIGSEIADHVLAGHETTGITLSYMTWQLSRPLNKHWQEKLCNELQNFKKKNMKDGHNAHLDYTRLDQECPVLHAIIQETCRLHAAIPGSERRYVPDNIVLKYQSFKLPSGTMVSCQPYSLHRIKKVFGEDVDSFNPQRWLKDKDETDEDYSLRIKTMERHMMTFGQGNRMCLGMHLALIEMKACIASIYGDPLLKNSKISQEWCENIISKDNSCKIGYSGLKIKNKNKNKNEFVKLTDVDKMRMADSYTTRPLFDECWLVF